MKFCHKKVRPICDKRIVLIIPDLFVTNYYIAQTLPKKPKSQLQRYRLLRKGKDVLA